jgi:hypothetical protein
MTVTPDEANTEQERIARRYLEKMQREDEQRWLDAEAAAEQLARREAQRQAVEDAAAAATATQAAIDLKYPHWVQARHRQHAGVFTVDSFEACPDPDCASFRAVDVQLTP